MPARYIISTTPEAIESKFGVSLRGKAEATSTEQCETPNQPSDCEAQPKQSLGIENNLNISHGHLAPVITNEKPHEVQLFKFGLTPFWSKSEMNLFNARAEGDYNQDDNPAFRGAAGIILKKAFRKPIRSQRCIVIASAFIEGPSKLGLSKPYLIYLSKHQNPFAIAGIWDTWLNPQTGFKENSFAIITTTANSLLRQIGNPRMPVILTDGEAKRWISDSTPLSRVTSMLKHYDSNLMNAYPIDPQIKDPLINDKQLIQPIGPRLLIEQKSTFIKYPHTSGYHQSRRAHKSADTSTMAERLEIAKSIESQTNN